MSVLASLAHDQSVAEEATVEDGEPDAEKRTEVRQAASVDGKAVHFYIGERGSSLW